MPSLIDACTVPRMEHFREGMLHHARSVATVSYIFSMVVTDKQMCGRDSTMTCFVTLKSRVQ